MGAVVYASAGGAFYHRAWDCPAFERGQLIHDWDYDYEFPPPADFRPPTTHPLREMPLLAAVGVGKRACATCIPRDGAAPMTSSEDDFGHEPVQMMRNGFGYASPICARCHIRRRTGWEDVPWPCTSAVVLGLVDPAVTQ